MPFKPRERKICKNNGIHYKKKSRYCGPRGDTESRYGGATKTVNVACQIGGRNICNGIVVRRDTDVNILAFVDLCYQVSLYFTVVM